MNRSMLMGAVFGAAVATAGGGLAGYQMMKEPEAEPAAAAAAREDDTSHFAEVLSAAPVTERVETPREECHDEVVTRQKPVKDTHQVTGTVIGAVAGGLLGDALGGGGKNTGAKVLGAAAGGYAGNKAQERMQQNATYQTTERVCRTVTDVSEHTIGYDVTYRLDGATATVRMDHDPGTAIPVRDGQPVLARASHGDP